MAGPDSAPWRWAAPAAMVELLDALGAVAECKDLDNLELLSAPERASWLVHLRSVINRAEGLFEHTLSSFDAQGDGETLHAAASTGAWLRGALHLAPGDASERVQIARASRKHLATSVAALTEGLISYDHVRAIERSMRRIPEDDREEAAALLTDLAKQAGVSEVRIAGRRLEYVTNPDGALRDEEQRFESRYLTISPLLDGMTAIDGLLDTESAAILNTALSPFMVPLGPEDLRNAAQRRADGLTEIARATCDHSLLPEISSSRPHVDVICSLGPEPSVLTSAPGIGLLGRFATQRITCDANVSRVLLAAEAAPLEYGRTRRLFSKQQRRALAFRDGGCRFPYCHRSPAFTDAHHVVSWLDGGETNLTNALLLCRFHHRQVHEGGWQIETTDPVKGGNSTVVFFGPDQQKLASRPRRL